METRKIHIAIDGPAGAGKSTVAKLLAERLQIPYLDTGAMYRVVAHQALLRGIALEDEMAVTEMAGKIQIDFDAEHQRVYCDGVDVTSEIRISDVGRAVATVATYPGVRKHLIQHQRQEASKGSLVMDGRDIGTNVLPDAHVKIFLTASAEERAKRRYNENKQKEQKLSLDEVMKDMLQRDQTDTQRAVSPLRPAQDAIILDTTGLTIEEVIDKIVAIVKKEA